MQFVENTTSSPAGEIRTIQVDRWVERGIAHGFCDRSLPSSELGTRWPAYCPDRTILLLQQSHSKKVISATPEHVAPSVEYPSASHPEGDSWILDTRAVPAAVAGIRTADCFPVLVVSTAVPICAAVHCGWRGAENGILLDTLVLMGRMGAPARSLEVAIGPGAQANSYEIGLDVSKLLQRAIGFVGALAPTGPVVESRDGKLFANLVNLLMAQAGFFGVRSENLIASAHDTIAEERFFSHRREKEGAGRQISFVGL